jgi:hypothetical protein
MAKISLIDEKQIGQLFFSLDQNEFITITGGPWCLSWKPHNPLGDRGAGQNIAIQKISRV